MLTNSIHKDASRYLALEPVLKSLVDDDSAWERVAEEQDECLTRLVYTPADFVSELFWKVDVWRAYRGYVHPADDLLLASILRDRARLSCPNVMVDHHVAQ